MKDNSHLGIAILKTNERIERLINSNQYLKEKILKLEKKISRDTKDQWKMISDLRSKIENEKLKRKA
jgi:hypothetical protein